MKLFLVGGGEIGRPIPGKEGEYFPYETLKIDTHFISLLKKEHPNILFIPTASEEHDSGRGYENTIKKYFGDKLGCQVKTLYLIQETPSEKKMKDLVQWSDGIYVGGGDTKTLVDTWESSGFEKLIKGAVFKGKIAGGVSAGAICWFEYAFSNYRKLRYHETEIAPIKGLGILKGACIAHYHRENTVPPQTEALVSKMKINCLAVDDYAAIFINEDEFKIIKEVEKSEAYKISLQNNKIKTQILTDRILNKCKMR